MMMRGILFGTAIALMLPTAAMAAGEGFYVGGAGGLNWTRDAKLRDGGVGVDTKLDFDSGWVGSLSAGYATALGIRAELEANYRWGNDVKGDNDAAGTWDGKARSLGFMGNVLYDIKTGTAFTPYIGIGAGIARVTQKLNFTPTGAASSLRYASDDDWVFAYQGIAGVAYNVTNNLAITADYRYFATQDPKFNTAFATSAESQYRNHSVMVGLRYSFGAPAVTPAAAAAPPAAPVAQQPQTEYLVFFDWDKSNITPVSDKIIGDAAAAAGQMRAVGIHVIGHTDTSGQPAYNQKLSMRRADAVKRALIAKGVPAGQISVEGKGETSPLVQTANNVREPSNRRAQVLIRVQ